MQGGTERYDVGGEMAEAFLVRPRRPVGSVIVVHTVGGFTRHIEETCERLADLGFAAAAPLLYWREKDLFTPERIREAMKVVWDLDLRERYDKKILASAVRKNRASGDVASLLHILYHRPFRTRIMSDLTFLASKLDGEARGAVGSVGYSMGGKLAVQLGAEFTRLRGAVTYSAEPPDRKSVAKVRFPVLALYGGRDTFMARRVPAFVEDALASGMDLDLKTYPSAGHEFFDREKREYDLEASEDAWDRTAAFLLGNVARGGRRSPPPDEPMRRRPTRVRRALPPEA